MGKKLAFLFSLAVVSTAVQAQQQPAPRYLMLIREARSTDDTQLVASLTVVEPDGAFKTEELISYGWTVPKKVILASVSKALADSTSWPLRRERYSRNTLYQAEIRKLNELSAGGWVLITTLQEGNTVKYLFRKPGL